MPERTTWTDDTDTEEQALEEYDNETT